MGELEARLADAEKERDCLQRQMAASLPQVRLFKPINKEKNQLTSVVTLLTRSVGIGIVD